MKQFLIIPNISGLDKSLDLAEKYSLGFEFNDFFYPDILDNEAKLDEIAGAYLRHRLPDFRTSHGAFFDVITCSPDKRISEIGDMRVRQSIAAARKAGACAVVFHTNYNPFLNSPAYIADWLDKNAAYWGKILGEYPDVNIYLENMFDSSPDIMQALAERLRTYKSFGLCLDIAHASLTDIPLSEWVNSLGKYVRHLHINDNDLKSDLHLAVGDGLIDWNEFYRLYEQYLERASVLIETSSYENQLRSVQRLAADGFMKV